MIWRRGGDAARGLIVLVVLRLMIGSTGFGADRPSAVVSLRALQIGMTANDVESVLGAPDQRLTDRWVYNEDISITFQGGRLVAADADWKTPRTAKDLFSIGEKFDSIGPAQKTYDSTPVEWVIGKSRVGQRWWILLDGRVGRWHLGPAWRTDNKPLNYDEIRRQWLKPYQGRNS